MLTFIMQGEEWLKCGNKYIVFTDKQFTASFFFLKWVLYKMFMLFYEDIMVISIYCELYVNWLNNLFKWTY